MFFRIVFFILCLPLHFLTGSTLDIGEPVFKGTAPSWVQPCNFPLEAVPVKPCQVNLQYLLIDTQRNWEEKVLYSHFVIKALTQSGLEQISQIHIDFDPSYYQVIVHAIRICRDGQWFDRLENSHHNVIQREEELDQNLYVGDLTLVYFLNDIRVGDIIEYSYSLVGQHPLFVSHYVDMVFLQRESPIEKITHRLLGHPDLSFQIKPINTTIKPEITDLSPSLREWKWEVSETLAHTYEPDQPIWHNPVAHIEMSQYKTWGEVAQKLTPLYRLPSDFTQSVPFDMWSLVEKWKKSTNDLAERALQAIRFVQDEVRYLGIEEGMGAFQPTAPSITFQRRFGDCKDQTFLLHALLQLMDISSKPLLVHSSRGKRLPEVLPIPLLFNHIVLQLELDGATYWVDPTLSLQGGSLQTNFFPNYEWGLLLSDDTETLTSLPKPAFKTPIEIDSSFVLESEDFAHLNIKTTFYGFRADRFRRSLKWNGLKKISDESLSDMQEAYGAVTIDSPMEALDDRENNTLTLLESYRLPTQTLSNKKVLELFSFIHRNYLRTRINPERTSPYTIPYPLWVKEHIHIESPFVKWKPFENVYKQEHESLLYTLSTQIKENSADYNFELKHLQDQIPTISLHDYWCMINDIDQKKPPKMTITSSSDSTEGKDFSLLYLLVGFFIWPIIYFLSRKKKSIRDRL